MMRWIVGSSLHLRFLVLAVAAAMMFIGISQLRTMPVDVFPEFAPPFVEIQTEAPGMSSQEVESLVTIPLEDALNSTPELDTMRSKSVPGLSAITLIFKPGTDIMEARQLVQERLAIAIRTLPSWAGIPWMLPPLSATRRDTLLSESPRSPKCRAPVGHAFTQAGMRSSSAKFSL